MYQSLFLILSHVKLHRNGTYINHICTFEIFSLPSTCKLQFQIVVIHMPQSDPTALSFVQTEFIYDPRHLICSCKNISLKTLGEKQVKLGVLKSYMCTIGKTPQTPR